MNRAERKKSRMSFFFFLLPLILLNLDCCFFSYNNTRLPKAPLLPFAKTLWDQWLSEGIWCTIQTLTLVISCCCYSTLLCKVPSTFISRLRQLPIPQPIPIILNSKTKTQDVIFILRSCYNIHLLIKKISTVLQLSDTNMADTISLLS